MSGPNSRAPKSPARLPGLMFALVLCGLRAACGQRGPLYLPDAAPAGAGVEQSAEPADAVPADAPEAENPDRVFSDDFSDDDERH